MLDPLYTPCDAGDAKKLLFNIIYVRNKEVNFVPYRPVRPKYTVPAGEPVQNTPLFRTDENTGHTGRTSW